MGTQIEEKKIIILSLFSFKMEKLKENEFITNLISFPLNFQWPIK